MEAVNKSLDMLDAVEAAHRGPLATLLTAAVTAILEQTQMTQMPRALPEPVRREILARLRGLWLDSIRGGSQIAEELIKFSAKASTLNLLDDYISEFGAYRAQQILNTTERQIRDMVAGGMAAGEAADAVYASIFEKIPGLAQTRAVLITRTEAHAASQFASMRLALQSTVPLVKVWNSTPDERTRDFGEVGKISQFNHRIMDGVKVPLAQVFRVPSIIGGSENLMFPGDPRGSAGNVINCRCIQTYERG